MIDEPENRPPHPPLTAFCGKLSCSPGTGGSHVRSGSCSPSPPLGDLEIWWHLLSCLPASPGPTQCTGRLKASPPQPCQGLEAGNSEVRSIFSFACVPASCSSNSHPSNLWSQSLEKCVCYGGGRGCSLIPILHVKKLRSGQWGWGRADGLACVSDVPVLCWEDDLSLCE